MPYETDPTVNAWSHSVTFPTFHTPGSDMWGAIGISKQKMVFRHTVSEPQVTYAIDRAPDQRHHRQYSQCHFRKCIMALPYFSHSAMPMYLTKHDIRSRVANDPPEEEYCGGHVC